MKMHPLLKLALELGPLAVFFVVNSSRGIYAGTAVFMAATVIALAVSYAIARTIPVMPLVTGVFVVVFGGLTLYLANDVFIKLKPTIVNLTFAAILFIGLRTRRLFIKLVLESALQLTERGWIILTRAWIGYFLVLAAINEIVWRTTSTDTWVTFKVFGIMPLTLLFSAATVPIMLRHALQTDTSRADTATAAPSDDAPIDRT
ncbi:MAG: septation protein A [Rhodospirillaceae bacterium]